MALNKDGGVITAQFDCSGFLRNIVHRVFQLLVN
jgi:hypothetical protein